MGSTPSTTVCPGLAYHRPLRGLHSRIIHACVEDPEVKQLDLRPIFRETPLSHVTPDKQHNHARSAAARSAAVDTSVTIVEAAGRRPYHVSMSKADMRRGDAGDRFLYMSKDLTIPYRYDPIGQDDVLVMTDVDYYVDMPLFLTEQDNSVLLYTITPRAVAGSDLDGHFCFRSNMFEENIAGAATYSHLLWDYGNDHFNVGGFRAVIRWIPVPNPLAIALRLVEWGIQAFNWIRSQLVCGPSFHFDRPIRDFRERHTVLSDFPFSFPIVYPTFVHKTFLCERRALTEHRSLILLQQQVKLRGWGALYAHYWGVDSVPLKRLEPLQRGANGKNFNVIQVVTAQQIYYSIGLDAGMATVEVPAHILGALDSAWTNSKSVLTRSAVESYLPRSDDSEGTKMAASTLLDYLKNRSQSVNIGQIFITEPFIAYQYSSDARTYDEDAKLPMHAFMCPILGPIPVADLSKANEELTVSERINKIKHSKELRISKTTRQYMREYIELMVPEHQKWSLHPVDIDVVFERQSRPTQRRILEEADANVSDNPSSVLNAFQKAQVENKIGAPRNISTVQPVDKMHYAKFCYAYGDYLNDNHLSFVQPSKTPRAISMLIAESCSRASFVSLGDFSKMDGRKSNVGRELWSLLLLRLFAKSHHQELVATIRRSYGNTCYTKQGVKYFQDFSEASGCASTSLANGNENAFCAYMACRFMGMEPITAFRQLFKSSFTGDDSFMPDISLEKYISAAKCLGHVVEGRVATRTNRDYVDYLSRYFGPDVWFGDPTSCSDIKRRAWGLHATHIRCFDEDQKYIKALEKARSYSLTDGKTPIIGDWARAFLELHQHSVDRAEFKEPCNKTPARDVSWWGRFEESDQWIQDGPIEWMYDFAERQLPNFSYDQYKLWLYNAVDKQNIKLLFEIPCFLSEPLTVESIFNVVFTNDTGHLVKRVQVKDGELISAQDVNKAALKQKDVESKLPAKSNEGKKKKKRESRPTPQNVRKQDKAPAKPKSAAKPKNKGPGKPGKTKRDLPKQWRQKDPATSKNGS